MSAAESFERSIPSSAASADSTSPEVFVEPSAFDNDAASTQSVTEATNAA